MDTKPLHLVWLEKRCCPGLRCAASSQQRHGALGAESEGGAQVRVHPGGSQTQRWQLGWMNIYGIWIFHNLYDNYRYTIYI